MIFPTPLQAQASANALISLAHSKYLGRSQIYLLSVAAKFQIFLSVLTMLPTSLQAQTSANWSDTLAHSKYLERFRIIF